MNREIMNSVKAALAETLEVDSIDRILDESKLKEDLGLDSMLSLTFLMALEENIEGFVVNAETLEADHLVDVASISRYVEEQLQGISQGINEHV